MITLTVTRDLMNALKESPRNPSRVAEEYIREKLGLPTTPPATSGRMTLSLSTEAEQYVRDRGNELGISAARVAHDLLLKAIIDGGAK